MPPAFRVCALKPRATIVKTDYGKFSLKGLKQSIYSSYYSVFEEMVCLFISKIDLLYFVFH